MTINSSLSVAAQEGLRNWAEAVWGDPMVLDNLVGGAAAWAWVCFLLRESKNRAAWFPKGRWATIQKIEGTLLEEARVLLGDLARTTKRDQS